MKRVLLVASICIAAQLGISSAFAAAPDISATVEGIMSQTFARTEAPDPNIQGVTGQSVASPPGPVAEPEPPAPLKPQRTPKLRSAPVAVSPFESSAAPASEPDAPGPVARQVSSTAFCLTGTMASGRRAYSGAVAMNGAALGSRYLVLSGPRAGETFTVEDRIGRGSAFDIAYPGDCAGAAGYARRTISIRAV